MIFKCSFKSFVQILAVLIIAFGVTGCLENYGASPSDGETSTTAGLKTKAGPSKTTALYYDFEDILVPKDLKVVQDRTVVISTPGYTSGILVVKGRVERRSLINFFINNMQKDNWDIISQIKSPENSIIVFDKASKCAVISIKANQYGTTYVEIGVAPKLTRTELPKDDVMVGPQGFSQGTLVE